MFNKSGRKTSSISPIYTDLVGWFRNVEQGDIKATFEAVAVSDFLKNSVGEKSPEQVEKMYYQTKKREARLSRVQKLLDKRKELDISFAQGGDAARLAGKNFEEILEELNNIYEHPHSLY